MRVIRKKNSQQREENGYVDVMIVFQDNRNEITEIQVHEWFMNLQLLCCESPGSSSTAEERDKSL